MKSYDKLRPYRDIKACECENINSLLLVDLISDNPIHCLQCKKEIDPEKLSLPDETVELVYSWKSVFNSLYLLWLDSGEYENWARSKLLDKDGRVNKLGQEATNALSKKLPTYLWWFWDADGGEPTHCPICKIVLNPNTKFGAGKCEECRIYI